MLRPIHTKKTLPLHLRLRLSHTTSTHPVRIKPGYGSQHRGVVTWIGVRSMRVDGERGSMTSLCLSVVMHLWASGSGLGVEATDNLLSLDPIVPI